MHPINFIFNIPKLEALSSQTERHLINQCCEQFQNIQVNTVIQAAGWPPKRAYKEVKIKPLYKMPKLGVQLGMGSKVN